MTKVMQGVRVLEVARFVFVPAAGAFPADWRADLIKVGAPTSSRSSVRCAAANDAIFTLEPIDGSARVRVVRNPVQFDLAPVDSSRALALRRY